MAGRLLLANVQMGDIVEELENRALHHRIHNIRGDAFELSDQKFSRIFRLNKDLAQQVIDLYEERTIDPTRLTALDSQTKVLTALRFYAAGSYQLDVGMNLNLAVSQPSVSRCIRDVNNILNQPDIFNEWVHFPRNIPELQQLRKEFFAQYGFPGVIGCIDCTHVAIVPPKLHDPIFPEHAYVNRKQYHSINVQLICDSRMKILNVNARYPGSTHDQFIWNNCNVLPVLETLHNRGHTAFHLIGDSGYALRPWLLTPISNAVPDSPEARYNNCFTSTRSLIERCNGLLKMRFRCLLKHRVLHYAPTTASKIINACVVLHNMCVEANLPPPNVDDLDEELMDLGMYENQNPPDIQQNNAHLAVARRIQERIVRHYFTHARR